MDWRQIFRRLWVRQIRFHSADTFSKPRSRNLRMPRTPLIWPKTGSMMCLRRVQSFARRGTEFVLHLFLDACFCRGFGGRGGRRCLVVLLAAGGQVRIQAHLLQPCDRVCAEVTAVGRVRNRLGHAVGILGPFDLCRFQVFHSHLGHRYCLLLIVGLSGNAHGYDDLHLGVHHCLRIERIIEALVALLHDLGFGIGEVRLCLGLGSRVNGGRLFAAAFVAFGLALGLVGVATALLLGRPGRCLGFQACLGFLDLRQPHAAPLQL